MVSFGEFYAISILTVTIASSNDPRIVGGQEITIDQVPYLVNLRQNGQFACGGSLLTPRCVLTAAHCVYRVPASSLTISAGASKLSEITETRQVYQSFVSSFYSPTTFDMDVAVLKLTEPFRGPNVLPIALCSNRPANSEFVQISGWGVTSEGNRQPSNQVRTANVSVVSNADCIKAYNGQAKISSTMFCATIPGQKDSCSGDSGGPVVYRGQVCGIVSWGIGCARPEYPGVYTNVANLKVNSYVKGVLMSSCM